MSPALTNPLELPELLKTISRFVTLNDAVACARVCKAWSDHFVSAIWHTIDFDVHKNLHQMDTKALAKYGHHVRVVKNIKDRNPIMVLIVSNASKLRQLSVTMTATQEFYANFSDLLRRINASIEHIDISQPSSGTAPFFTIDSFFPISSSGTASRLSFIKINGLTMTRDTFSSLLMACSALYHLSIRGTNLLSWPLYDKSGASCYQHTGITYLTAPIEQVFRMDSQSQNAPSLFVHFPNLKTWTTWKNLDVDVSIEEIRNEVTRCCPSIKTLRTETTATIAIGMLVQVFCNLTTIGIKYDQFSTDLVMAILNHQETLNSIFTFTPRNNFYDSEVVPEVEGNQLNTSGWIIQSIPRRCPRLKSLKFQVCDMSMDDIEMADWGCHNLEELYIRVRGLDTKEKIDQATQLWKEGRAAIKKQVDGEQEVSTSTNHQLDRVIPPNDNSIEARVARHLLKFKKLREVWLGWKIRKVRA